MGHCISAIVCKLPLNTEKAEEFYLPIFANGDFAIVGLNAHHSDYWANKLGIDNKASSQIRHDTSVTRAFARALEVKRFALIETDYFGGIGEQFATVYENDARILEVTEDGINQALSLLGVVPLEGEDEFDRIGLGNYRSFDDHFEKYWHLSS